MEINGDWRFTKKNPLFLLKSWPKIYFHEDVGSLYLHDCFVGVDDAKLSVDFSPTHAATCLRDCIQSSMSIKNVNR